MYNSEQRKLVYTLHDVHYHKSDKTAMYYADFVLLNSLLELVRYHKLQTVMYKFTVHSQVILINN